ncbi:MAG: outer membrane beta-barrel domain-containing protein [Myxococcota bacterium]
MISKTTVGGAFAAIIAGGLSLRAPPAHAQAPPEEEGAPSAEPAEPAEQPEAAPGEILPSAQPPKPPKPSRVWKDIVVVPRKPVLKIKRFELAPFAGVNINDPLIGHYSLGAEVNYFLTDVLSVGVAGSKFFKDQQDLDLDVRRTYRLAARTNSYDYGASLNFGYVPAYGKFTIFNRWLLHWEGLVTAGVGVVHTTIIPRQPDDPKFSTMNIAPNLGMGGRIWLTRWMSVFFLFRDFIYNDHFEPTDREGIEDEYCRAQDEEITGSCRDDAIDRVSDKAETGLVNNIMFMAGASFFLPTDFQYTTFR